MAYKNDKSGTNSVSELHTICKLVSIFNLLLFPPYRNESVKWSDVAKSDNEETPQQHQDNEIPLAECVAYSRCTIATEESGIYEPIPE